MKRQAYSHLGPGDKDFDTLANVAYRAFRRAGLDKYLADEESLSFAYGAAELLDDRVGDHIHAPKRLTT